PANLNVVAALSLAGIGPDRTRVVLVADPTGERNTHEITARGAFGELYLRLDNRPTPGNPKTRLLAPLSALALLRRLSSAVQIGSGARRRRVTRRASSPTGRRRPSRRFCLRTGGSAIGRCR